MNTNPFELYSSHPKCAEGNHALQQAVDAAWNEAKPKLKGIDPYEDEHKAGIILNGVFNKYVRPVMFKYVDAGASDTEPRVHALEILNKRATQEYGFSEYLEI